MKPDPKTEKPTVEPAKDETSDALPDSPTVSGSLAPLQSTEKPPKHIVISAGRIVAVLVVLVATAIGVQYVRHHSEHSASTGTQHAAVSKVAPAPAKPKVRQQVALTTSDATYLDAPKQVNDLHVFSKPSSLGQICTDGDNCRPVVSSDIHYYQIGTMKDGRQILAFVAPTDGPGENMQIMLGDAGKYQILAQMDSSSTSAIKSGGAAAFVKSNLTGFTSNVSYDTKTKLANLGFPGTLTAKGQSYAISYDDGNGNYGYFMPHGSSDIRGGFYGTTTVAPTELGTAGNKTVYDLVARDDANFRVIETYATFGSLFANRYNLQNSLLGVHGSDKVLSIQWQNGQQNKSAYFSAASGCGTDGYVVAKGITASQLTSVGESGDGQQLYQLSIDAPLSQELYNKDYGESKDALSDTSLKSLTMRQFMDDHAYVIFKDTMGEYVVLQRSDLFETGGCAKPVVYLYPQQQTTVSVRVGARVSVSDPLYTANGWQNVIAEPSGALSYEGKTYGSLFWEGKGYGGYPGVTSGTIVSSGQVVATIKSQLKAQGLNAKETADFLAYWQPKLPKTPYVRLTWFDTAQMNILAPLNISPRPQTVIRVFLDFDGLQKPENMPPQQFVAPARQGFTVVEWGGLARGGLQG